LKDFLDNKKLNKLLEEIIKEQEMRRERIEELKRLIREKNYNVPVEEIVEKMLEKFRKKVKRTNKFIQSYRREILEKY
jgi:anti-sigma28 factor (negative regulator of flagellin synthesis)